MRLDRLLGNMGYGVRRDVHALAAAGRIRLDGAALRDGAARIALSQDLPTRMTVNGEPLDPLPGVSIMLHKPVGVTCSQKDAGPLVYELLPARWRRREPALSTVGRLDKDTSGLLLLTDDGALLHRIISPKAAIGKRYRARLDRPLRGDEAAIFAAGALMLDGESAPLLPAELDVVGPAEAVLTIREGRYHQVRRMFAAVGNHVNALHRDAIGALELPSDLPAGSFKLMTQADLAAVFR
jgi:16S rRNA pseudouridine516 synthase